MIKKYHSIFILFFLFGLGVFLVSCGEKTTPEGETDQMAEENQLKEEPSMNIQKHAFGKLRDRQKEDL